MLWNSFGWNGFHGLIFKSTFLVKLFLEFFLSDWDLIFLLGAISKTEGIGYSNVELFTLSEFLGRPDGSKLIFFSLNGFLLDRLLELFLIAWGGVITLWEFLLLFSFFFLVDTGDLSLEIGDINLVFNFSGPSSVGEELKNFLNVYEGLCLIQESGKGLFNVLFFDVSVGLWSDGKVSDFIEFGVFDKFLDKLLFWHKVLSVFLNILEGILDNFYGLIAQDKDVWGVILAC